MSSPATKTTLQANVETAQTGGGDPNVLILASGDNVGTAIRDIAPGTRLTLGGRVVATTTAIALGHKIAVRDIKQGEKIVKYGAPIGSAIRPIAAGEHVHTHNIKSDYLPSFGRDQGNRMTGH